MQRDISFDKTQPSSSLYKLVLDYEKNPRKLEDAPQEFIDYFSLPALALSLNAVYPKLPYFDEEKVEKTMSGRDFSSIEQLANFIKNNFKTDIERYRAIYTWVTHFILFDVECLFSSRNSYHDPEDIFKYRKTCNIYKLVLRLVSLTEVKYSFTVLDGFGKGFGFQPNTPPSSPVDDDAPLLVEINGVTFISDPSWGSGHISKDRTFIQKYNPSLFLKPYVQGLHRHFPLKTVLPIRVRYSKFLQINCFDGYPYEFFLESHPFQKYYCDSGYMKFYFSCVSSVKKINTYLKYYDNQDKETDFNEDCTLNIISEKPRKRFYVKAAFQKTGKYRLRVWLENETVATYYINSTKAIEVVPFVKATFGKDVVPISPNVKTTKLQTNYAIIKIQVAKENADVLVNTTKGSQKLPRNYNYAIMLVPGNDNLREIWTCVPFPSSGFYEVHLYLYNGSNYTESIVYEFDVNIQENIENPTVYQFIKEKKTFAPIEKNTLQISPNDSAIIMKPGSFKFTALVPKNQKVLYNLKPKPQGNTIFADTSTTSTYNSSHDKVTTQFTAKTPGLYDLLAFVGDDNVWSQYYFVTNDPPSQSSSSSSSGSEDFLSSIANEPVILERPFVFPDDPNEDFQEEEVSTNTGSNTQTKNLAPASSAILEEASSASLSFLQKAANTNSEFLKNASAANSEFLRNARSNPSFLEEAMNMSASFLQQAGTLNALFYQQATSMVSEFLKVAESISKGQPAPSLSKNPVFQKKDIFVPPKIEVSQKFRSKRPITHDQSIQCTLSDDEYQEKQSKHQESSTQTNKSVQKPRDEKPVKIVETPEPKQEPVKPRNDLKILDEKSKKTVDPPKPKEPIKPKEDKPKSEEKTKKAVDVESASAPESSTPTILRELFDGENRENLYKNLKILDTGAPPGKTPKQTSTSVSSRATPINKSLDKTPSTTTSSKPTPSSSTVNKNLDISSSSSSFSYTSSTYNKSVTATSSTTTVTVNASSTSTSTDIKSSITTTRSKTLDSSTKPPDLDDDKSSSKSSFKNLINNFQTTPIRPMNSSIVPPPKPVNQPKKDLIPPPKEKDESPPLTSGGNKSFKDLINRFNKT